MATTKGTDFINKYKGTDCLKSSWELMCKKGHITLDEFVECAKLTEEEKKEYEQQICPVETEQQKISRLESEIEELTDMIIMMSQQ